MNIEKIGLIISFICIIFLFIDRKKNIENFDGHVNAEQSDVSLDEKINNALVNRNTEDVKKIVNEQYNMDIEAIRNLGTISKSLLTGTNYHNTTPGTPGELTIPSNVTTIGNQNINGNTNVKGTFSVGGHELLPAGSIIIWTTPGIPKGWQMCNGQNGTPDLRGRFILGAGNCGNANTDTRDGGGSSLYPAGHKYDLNKRGGVYKHTLTTDEMPSHKHDFTVPTINCTGTACPRHNPYTGRYSNSGPAGTTYNGGNQAHNNMPPYYTVFYIMKVY